MQIAVLSYADVSKLNGSNMLINTHSHRPENIL